LALGAGADEVVDTVGVVADFTTGVGELIAVRCRSQSTLRA
jgi:hypothetical protein